MSDYFETAGDALRRLAFRDQARREFVYGVLSPDQRWLNEQREREWLLQRVVDACAPAASSPVSSPADPRG